MHACASESKLYSVCVYLSGWWHPLHDHRAAPLIIAASRIIVAVQTPKSRKGQRVPDTYTRTNAQTEILEHAEKKRYSVVHTEARQLTPDVWVKRRGCQRIAHGTFVDASSCFHVYARPGDVCTCLCDALQDSTWRPTVNGLAEQFVA